MSGILEIEVFEYAALSVCSGSGHSSLPADDATSAAGCVTVALIVEVWEALLPPFDAEEFPMMAGTRS